MRIIAFYIFGLLFTDAVLLHLQSLPNCCDGDDCLCKGLGRAGVNGPKRGVQVNDNALPFHSGWFGLASTIRAADLNHEVMMENRTSLRAKAAKLFRRMDESGFGCLTKLGAFAMSRPILWIFLESIDINATDAWTLFDSLNLDGNEVLTMEEFTEGCLLLKGPARSVDVYALKQQSRKLRKQMEEPPCRMDSDLRALLQKQHEELLRTLDAWFLTSPKVSPVTSPHINSVTVKAAGLPNENSEDTLNRLKATSIATNEKPLGFSRLNSYEEAVATLSNSPTFPSLTVELGEGPCAQCWHQFQRLAFQFVSSYWANVFFAFAILSNSVFLGVQIEWRVENLGIVTTNPFVGVHLAYAVLFTCEAALRDSALESVDRWEETSCESRRCPGCGVLWNGDP
eukprot:g23631.t1